MLRLLLVLAALAGPAPAQTAGEGPRIRVNQLGYLPDGPKRATWITDATAPQDWALRDAEGQVLLQGASRVLGIDSVSGLPLHLIDFTAFDGTGAGLTLDAGGNRSHPFSVTASLYDGLARDALSVFYPLRSGIEIAGKADGNPYARAAGHIGVAPNQGDTEVPCQSADADGPYAAPWTCTYMLDVQGGWYDGGTFAKPAVPGAVAVAQLLSAFERHPENFADGDVAIPETGNGMPDILDEARWELDFLMRMRVPEDQPLAGLVHHDVRDALPTGLPLLPDRDGSPRQLHRPSTAATLNLAATAAQGARLFRHYDAAYADELLAAARAAWDAAEDTPPLLAPAEDGGGEIRAYADDSLDDERFRAAVELYLSTGEAAFLAEVDALTPAGTDSEDFTFDWQHVAGLGLLHLLTVPSDYPLPARDELRYRLLADADRTLAAQQASLWGAVYAPGDGLWPEGSNHLHLQHALILATAWDITGEAKYRDGALEAMDYLLGRNPVGISYVTGYGAHFAENQRSRWFAAALDPTLPHPPKGALAGGPTTELADPVAQEKLAGCSGPACYIDDIGSWSTNGLALTWNAALVQVAAALQDM